jgi:tetratricopeptide (TPR) repeat protein
MYVDDLIFDLFELDVDDKEVYAYNLLRLCPYAHSSLAMFLNIDQVTDYKQLLNVIIRAFELLHKNEMYKIKSRFYYHENYRDYILALESLASIHKWEGDFQSAIEQYQKALKFDDLDILNVKESILLPLLAEGDFEVFLDYTEQLDNGSLFYIYVKLFNGLVNTYEALDYKLFEDALTASPLIMKMLCTNEDLYEKASPEERRYLDDFYTVWLMQEDLLETLKNLYYKNSVS